MTRLLSLPSTCSWGRHTQQAAMERHHPTLGWLPACTRHLTAPFHLPASAVVRCGACGQSVRVRIDGGMSRHRAPGVRRLGPLCTAGGLPVDGVGALRQFDAGLPDVPAKELADDLGALPAGECTERTPQTMVNPGGLAGGCFDVRHSASYALTAREVVRAAEALAYAPQDAEGRAA